MVKTYGITQLFLDFMQAPLGVRLCRGRQLRRQHTRDVLPGVGCGRPPVGKMPALG
jgi:hypothetical protein